MRHGESSDTAPGRPRCDALRVRLAPAGKRRSHGRRGPEGRWDGPALRIRGPHRADDGADHLRPGGDRSAVRGRFGPDGRPAEGDVRQADQTLVTWSSSLLPLRDRSDRESCCARAVVTVGRVEVIADDDVSEDLVNLHDHHSRSTSCPGRSATTSSRPWSATTGGRSPRCAEPLAPRRPPSDRLVQATALRRALSVLKPCFADRRDSPGGTHSLRCPRLVGRARLRRLAHLVLARRQDSRDSVPRRRG